MLQIIKKQILRDYNVAFNMVIFTNMIKLKPDQYQILNCHQDKTQRSITRKSVGETIWTMLVAALESWPDKCSSDVMH